ncbi:lantibiotic dehydratase [Streptomyces sp. NPDC127069]|uniref:lantibiotic dehydratase n=1 Tax=Streptomyces sp. NPDC127069 TaxID=3347128 RepID=UPI003663E0D7
MDPLVRLAVEVGSPDLAAALERTHPEDPDARRLRGKLARYLIRMRTRPTPYGMFAGVALAYWSDHTDLTLTDGPPRTRTRPDMAWLLGLVHRLEADAGIRAQICLMTNPSTVLHGGRALLRAGTDPGAEAVSIRLTSAARRVLETARRPTPPATLAAGLDGLPGATPYKAAALIDELCAHGFLQTDLRPPLTDGDPTTYVARRLASVPTAQDLADRLRDLSRELADWDELPLTERTDARRQLVARALALNPLEKGTSVLQTDLALTLGGRGLHTDVAGEAARAAELLLRLSPHPCGPPRLDGYRRSFLARYGQERRVPLLELIDPDLGLGLPAIPAVNHLPSPLDQRRSRLLLDLALAATRDHRQVVELTTRQVEDLSVHALDPDACPPSLEIALSLAAASPAAVDAGDFQLVVGPNLGAPVAGRYIGRFADLLGPPARTALAETARLEQRADSDALLAELVYLPRRPRAANVAVRPGVRTHEIVVDGVPGVRPHQCVPLDELVVGLEAGRLSVDWPAGNTRVIGVQGHMLNPSGAPPAVRFLLDVAMDGRCQFTPFSWGPAGALAFLPRIQYGRIVLAPAQWRMHAGSMPVRASDKTFADALKAWREQWTVPRRVYLASGDNRLLLDLDDTEQVHVLHEELKRLSQGQSATYQEALPGPEHAWLPHGGRGHVCELVVPLVRADVARPVVTTADHVERVCRAPAGDRLKPPGSDWLYVKLYGAPWLQDQLIAGPVRTFTEAANASGLADTWFFVRYTDPRHHLRIRFHGERSALLGPLMDQICRWAEDLLTVGLVESFAFDTYEREVERYGGAAGIRTAETVFGADSACVARILRAAEDGELTLDHTELAVSSVDDLLDSMGWSPDERLALYRKVCPLSRTGGLEYRKHGRTLREMLGRPDCPDTVALRRLLEDRRAALEPAAALLASFERQHRLERTYAEVCASYVHMHLNRLSAPPPTAERHVLELLRRTREGLSRAPLEW